MTKTRRLRWLGVILSLVLPAWTGTCIGRDTVETMRLYEDLEWSEAKQWEDHLDLWPWGNEEPWVSAQTND